MISRRLSTLAVGAAVLTGSLLTVPAAASAQRVADAVIELVMVPGVGEEQQPVAGQVVDVADLAPDGRADEGGEVRLLEHGSRTPRRGPGLHGRDGGETGSGWRRGGPRGGA